MAWVNNQFQQYVYDVTDVISSPLHGNTNITVALESAVAYGQNVTSRPDAEWVHGDVVSPKSKRALLPFMFVFCTV